MGHGAGPHHHVSLRSGYAWGLDLDIPGRAEEAFKQELRHFYDAVPARMRPETDGHVGRRDIAVALDIYDAYARRVGLPVAQRS